MVLDDITIKKFWKYVQFTREAYRDSKPMARERVLREEDTATASEDFERVPYIQRAKSYIFAEAS